MHLVSVYEDIGFWLLPDSSWATRWFVAVDEARFAWLLAQAPIADYHDKCDFLSTCLPVYSREARHGAPRILMPRTSEWRKVKRSNRRAHVLLSFEPLVVGVVAESPENREILRKMRDTSVDSTLWPAPPSNEERAKSPKAAYLEDDKGALVFIQPMSESLTLDEIITIDRQASRLPHRPLTPPLSVSEAVALLLKEVSAEGPSQ